MVVVRSDCFVRSIDSLSSRSAKKPFISCSNFAQTNLRDTGIYLTGDHSVRRIEDDHGNEKLNHNEVNIVYLPPRCVAHCWNALKAIFQI